MKLGNKTWFATLMGVIIYIIAVYLHYLTH